MVLEKQATVKWFSPSRIASPISLTSELSKRSILNSSLGGNLIGTKPVTDRTTTSIAPQNQCTDPLTVFGSAFEIAPTKTLRRKRFARLRDVAQRCARNKHCRHQGPVYPSDSILTPFDRENDKSTKEDWITRNRGYHSCSSDEEGESLFDGDLGEARYVPLGWQDIYFSEMPMELLGDIFQRFMYVSRESLSRLAEERNQARNRASKRPSCKAEPVQIRRQLPHHMSKAGWGYSDFIDAEMTRERLHMNYPHQYHPCLHLSSRTGTNGYSFTSHAHHHRQQTLRQERRTSNAKRHGFLSQPISRHIHSDREQDYDAEEEDTIDSESGTEVSGQGLRSTRTTCKNVVFDLDLDRLDRLTGSDSWETDPSENNDEYDSSSSGSHELGFDPLLYSANTYSNEGEEDEDVDEYDDGEPSVAERMITNQSRLDEEVAIFGRSARLEHGMQQIRRKSHLGSLFQCSCHSGESIASVFPRYGINRVDSELDEDKMLDLLHRDQYFHPTTHVSLRSDLYNCSLVNRQWRIAALQLLWQSVVLDSESCRIEPSDPCYCCKTFEESKISRTRIEAMLDSYLDVYGLDLSKCVQTLELDLRIVTVARATEIHAVKRILKRLSPFTHLRLIWTDRGSSENQASALGEVLGSMHSDIRHLHFSSGFVISKAWVHEMEKMIRLETVTLENLGNLDVIEYDWRKIKTLRMYSVIPRTVFGTPSIATSAIASTISNITGDFNNGALAGETASIQAILASAATGIESTIISTPVSTLQNNFDPAASHELSWGAIALSSNTRRLNIRASGWWQWMSLRKLEIRIKNTVLPREWLQEFVMVITQNSRILEQQKNPRGILSRYQTVYHNDHIGTQANSVGVSFGPPLEVLDIDCTISHPHKDIFTQLVHAWGGRFEEFHFHQSAELTDEFFWLCLQKMTKVKKLSLRESRGITGEGVLYDYKGMIKTDHHVLESNHDPPNSGANTPETFSDAPTPSSHISFTTKNKVVKTPIMWRREFCELNLDQSRIRKEFLETLKYHCPGARYNVREVRR
ncbi:hypothetical protein BGZ49_007428 [Haplosporangium sp. Z 27]|nr:hypothetical protein BGZ49_007428 [Haplosporangium sp. Z 27]